MKNLLAIVMLIMATAAQAQAQDQRQTVAVPITNNELGKQTLDQYLPPITQKITQILNQTRRYIVVSRSEEEVKAEREFQANPEFLDRMIEAKKTGNINAVKDILDQNQNYQYLTFDTLSTGQVIFRGADYILKTELRKLDINKLINPDGSANGFKTLLGLQLSIIDAQTNQIIDAAGFTSEPLKIAMTTPARSVDQSLLTMETQIYKYLLAAIPVVCQVVKIEQTYFVINAGSTQGVIQNDLFDVMIANKIAGAEVTEIIGQIKVKALSGTENAVCNATKGADQIREMFKNGRKIRCLLVKSKRK